MQPTPTTLTRALPFWASLAMVPLSIIGAHYGGLAVLLTPIGTWGLFSLLDAIIGQTRENADPATPDADLYWYRAITLIWFPVQATLLFALIAYTAHTTHLGGLEKIGLFFGMGVISGTIGITYAHELMHQKSKTERWLADLLMASVLYSHFRTEQIGRASCRERVLMPV